ncbi:MAG TPA: hypothetical protein VNS34_11615 [Rhizobiaceae bacterium]|nr:hypothetical protein [Rhizobiaceae bacterium]
METDQNRRGLARLMLKMPALRGQLKLLSARSEEMRNLCGAFDEASSTLERLRRERDDRNADMIAEYEKICADIERDMLIMCAGDD